MQRIQSLCLKLQSSHNTKFLTTLFLCFLSIIFRKNYYTELRTCMILIVPSTYACCVYTFWKNSHCRHILTKNYLFHCIACLHSTHILSLLKWFKDDRGLYGIFKLMDSSSSTFYLLNIWLPRSKWVIYRHSYHSCYK